MESALSRSHIFGQAPTPIVIGGMRRQKNAPNAPVVSQSHRLATGEILFAPGDHATGPFQVVEGAVIVLRNLPGGRRQILDIAGRGRMIGFSSDARHDCEAVALSPATVVPVCKGRTDQSAAMLAEIGRLRDLATLLGRKTAIERIASFLVGMTGDGVHAMRHLSLPVSRLEIADYLGLVIETVCRNFVALRRHGIIATTGRDGVAILDLDALRQIAGGNGPVADSAGPKKA
jgi:CRP-like cAMP-binding protein